ncbi:MAG: DUF389 domain-containing protein [Candidatus Peribacteraceae bacterium]|nr:DUF389 domain-containing protein [Candidatus Peribacteraceae bacterium]MBP9850153.1 DUF389 domain-containing protein [Candidatus Peribacteraceae bacterium]
MFPFTHKPATLLGVSNSERQEAIEHLVDATALRHGYYLLLTLSVIIVTLGLLIDNTPIVIGGMVIAPVLTPILLLAVGIASHSVRAISHASIVLLTSMIIVLSLSLLLTWIVAYATPVTPVIPEQTNPIMYFVIAFCSGIVAGFAWVKKDLAATISGIAIAVSLLPPLCITGIGLAVGNDEVALRSMTVFMTNVFGILFAAVLTFVLLGFMRFTTVAEKTMKKEEKAEEAEAA